jgi:hypothetical protein
MSDSPPARCGTAATFDGLLFTTGTGQPIDRHNDRSAWMRPLKAADVPTVRLHDGLAHRSDAAA